MPMHTNKLCHGFCGYCKVRIPHDICRELGSNIITYTTKATQTYCDDYGNYNPFERDTEAKQRPEKNLPADSQYTMVMPQRTDHSSAARIMTTAPLNDWSKGWPRTDEIWSGRAPQTTSAAISTSGTSLSSTSHPTSATVTSTTTPTPAQQGRLQRATDPDVMGENDFNRTRQSRRQISTRFTASVTTTTTSPMSTSSNSVQIVQPPPPTVVEDLMMAYI
jgi:hypothetical protein